MATIPSPQFPKSQPLELVAYTQSTHPSIHPLQDSQPYCNPSQTSIVESIKPGKVEGGSCSQHLKTYLNPPLDLQVHLTLNPPLAFLKHSIPRDTHGHHPITPIPQISTTRTSIHPIHTSIHPSIYHKIPNPILTPHKPPLLGQLCKVRWKREALTIRSAGEQMGCEVSRWLALLLMLWPGLQDVEQE